MKDHDSLFSCKSSLKAYVYVKAKEAILSRMEEPKDLLGMRTIDLTKYIPDLKIFDTEIVKLRKYTKIRLLTYQKYGYLQGYEPDDIMSEVIEKVITGERKKWNRKVYKTPLEYLQSVAKSIISNTATSQKSQNDKLNNHIDTGTDTDTDYKRFEKTISLNPEDIYVEQQETRSTHALYLSVIDEVSNFKPHLKNMVERILLYGETSAEELSKSLNITQDKVKNDKKTFRRFLKKYEIVIVDGSETIKLKGRK